MILNTGLALFILLASAAAAFWMARRWEWSSVGRRPGARHWITRTICGVLGLGIVLAITVSTIQAARAPYADPPKVDLRVPTLPAPEFGPATGPIKKGRFLLHVAVVTQLAGVAKPLYAETYDVRWPEDRERPFLSKQRFGNFTVDYLMEIHEIVNVGARAPVLDFRGTRQVNARSLGQSSSSSGGVNIPEVQWLPEIGDRSSAFSIQRTSGESNALLFDLTPVREDDPLRTGTFSDFLAIRGAEDWARKIDQHQVNRSGRYSADAAASPAEALIHDLRGILLLLLIASILLAQLFRRRSLGFVKIAASLLLFVGALDRVVLRLHESRVKDASAPVEQRLAACALLDTTSFFRETAARDLDAAAGDPGYPPALRDLARRLADPARKNHFP